LAWNAQVGKVIQSIGSPFFHEELISLLDITVASDAYWIIRYTGEALPDVVFTRGVSARTRHIYSRVCAPIDPFSARWRSEKRSGILTLDRLRSNDPAYATYRATFLSAAAMDDELCIILPITAHSCFAIFLERRNGLFSKDEVSLFETVYPAVEGWCQSHLGSIFTETKKSDFSAGAPGARPATAIFDHAGHHVYSNDNWSRAAHRFPALKPCAAKLAVAGGSEHLSEEWVLRMQRLSSDFPLAPNGSMLVLEKVPVASIPCEVNDPVALFTNFTQRERDVLCLILKGLKNSEISETLDVGGGSIRNIKLRLYRKSGVASEGELVSKFLAFANLL
jgi:DNA-binding CsgD family transcriptional regulator